ncbi:MAG: helix-turn-helix domain-containing protein [Candidatus Micrarchaeia archaeon]
MRDFFLDKTCDLCGKPAVAQAKVEGATVGVCKSCASFGQVIEKPKPVFAFKKSFKAPKQFSIVEDYGGLIKKAREKKGLSRNDLAKKIFVTDGELARIEEEHLAPREKVARKLEKELNIVLASVEVEEETTSSSAGSSRGLTLADLVTIKKKD